MIYYFSIAGIRLKVELPVDLTVTYESEAFQAGPFENPDMEIRVRFTDAIAQPNPNAIYYRRNFYYSDPEIMEIHRCLFDTKVPYSRLFWRREEDGVLHCETTSYEISKFFQTSNLMNLIGLENILFFQSTLLLHSSFVTHGGGGILFTAPSGTGKSTQADLWMRHEGADIINGDRAALRKLDGIWTAWGLPYAGSSAIYRNESAPVRALVVLRQAKENRIRRLTPAESLRYVYPELSIHRWDPEFVNKAVNLYLDLAGQVPVFLLECLPDAGAVKLLKDTLTEGGV